MQIKELIKELRKQDGEAEVFFYQPIGSSYGSIGQLKSALYEGIEDEDGQPVINAEDPYTGETIPEDKLNAVILYP